MRTVFCEQLRAGQQGGRLPCRSLMASCSLQEQRHTSSGPSWAGQTATCRPVRPKLVNSRYCRFLLNLSWESWQIPEKSPCQCLLQRALCQSTKEQILVSMRMVIAGHCQVGLASLSKRLSDKSAMAHLLSVTHGHRESKCITVKAL